MNILHLARYTAGEFFMRKHFLLLPVVIWVVCMPVSASGKISSWGLPGSSRERFESLSHGCAIEVVRRDVSDDRSTKKFLRGFEVLERENNMVPMPGLGMEDDVERGRRQVLIRKAYSTEQHIDGLQSSLQKEMDECLRKSGYIKFRLTKDQERASKKLKSGTERRKQYLYELRSNKDVVLSQAVAE